jgi:hypothetical protein
MSITVIFNESFQRFVFVTCHPSKIAGSCNFPEDNGFLFLKAASIQQKVERVSIVFLRIL